MKSGVFLGEGGAGEVAELAGGAGRGEPAGDPVVPCGGAGFGLEGEPVEQGFDEAARGRHAAGLAEAEGVAEGGFVGPGDRGAEEGGF